MSRATVLWLAIGSSVAYVALGGIAIGTGLTGPSDLVWLLVSGPPLVAAAGYLMWHRPQNQLGPLLMVTALAAVVVPTVLEIPTVLRFRETGPEAWMWAPMWASQELGLVGAATGAAVVGLLPDGRPRYRHDRLFGPLVALVAAIPLLGLASNEFVQVTSFQFPGLRDVPSPVFIRALEPVGPTVTAIGFLANLVIGLGVWALFVRYRRTTPAEQRQLRWVLVAGVTAIVFTIIPSSLGQLGLVPEFTHGPLAVVAFLPGLLIPFAVVATIVEPSWIDVDFVIRKSVVYGTLSVLILATYVAGAAWVGVAAGSALPIETAILITVVVAVALQPVRTRLQRWADRRVFGDRPTRYDALAGFGAHVDEGSDPLELLEQLASTSRRAARLGWATASVPGFGSRTSGQRSGSPAVELELRHRDELIGSLVGGAPANGTLDPGDIALLQALASQAGLAVSNARLAGRIVAAGEEERRRIERNLHDGAQQELIALIAKLSLARSAVEAGGLDVASIDELQAAARRILADVREIAQGIHPSIVTDGGILTAIEERCASLPLTVRLDVEPGLRGARFAAQVEGAAYFLVAESLANVLQHARAAEVVVALRRAGDRLALSVEDDGTGFDLATARRRGLAGLEDRFTALGGTVSIASRPGGGTRVTASLPVS